MNRMLMHLQRNVGRTAAVAILCALYMLARLPTIPSSERQALANRFHFDHAVLPVVPGPEVRSVRPVNPSLQHIAAWISSVGAAVALNDLDGDGLPNDLCYVDVRTDQVIVAPAPGTGDRYRAFAIDAGPLFSRATMAPMGCLPGDMKKTAEWTRWSTTGAGLLSPFYTRAQLCKTPLTIQSKSLRAVLAGTPMPRPLPISTAMATLIW